MSVEKRSIFLMVLIMMSATGLFATDIYLAALPQMTQYFNCTQSEIQASFTVFLLGLAVCQIVYGILSDHFGRRPILLFGLSLFILASLLCAFAVDLSQFIIFRLLQAIGGGAGSVVCRAIVSNRYSRKESIKIFSSIFPIIGLSAAIAPLIGGYLTHFFGWRASFYFMAVFGTVTISLVLLFLPKTVSETNNRPMDVTVSNIIYLVKKALSLSNYLDVLKNIQFLGYALILCAGFAVFRCYAVESPFVFDTQGYLAKEMSHFYFGLSIAYLIGNFTAKHLVNTRTLEEVIRLGFCFSILGGLAMIISAHIFEENPYAIILPMSMITLGNGFLFPTGSAGAMAAVPHQVSGMASGLMGALQFITAALCVHWVGDICQGQAQNMSFYISSIILIGLCCFLMILSRIRKTGTTA